MCRTRVLRAIRLAALLAALASVRTMVVTAQASETPAWPPELEAQVRALVARAWDTEADSVVIAWSRAPRDLGVVGPADVAGVDLLGRGRGGYWVVQLRRPGAASRSVRIRAGVRTARPVAAVRLARGQEVTPADVRWAPWVVWGRPADAPPADPTGWVAQRVVEPGAPLVAPAVRPADAVVTGQTVEAWYRTGAVGVRIVARAQGGGPVGARVHVRTPSGRRLAGVVTGPGVVEIVQGAPARGPGGES